VQVCVSKTLYARVYMWLNVTDCHRALTAGGLSDAFAVVIQAVRYQQGPFHPIGLVGAFGFPEAALLACETLAAQSSSSISLLSHDDFGFKCAENFESQKMVCTCKQVHITSLPESDQQTSVTFDKTDDSNNVSHVLLLFPLLVYIQ